jgi:hypothetical protein
VKYHRFLLLIAIFTSVAGAVRAVTTIYPVGAIEDLWQLPAEEFRQKYAGINATGLGPSDEGWYVRYRHENMTLLFGPLAEREDARKQKWDLETVRDAAIRNRPALASSQVDYVKFSYSGVYGKGGAGNGGRGSSGEGEDGDGSGKDGKGNGDKEGRDGSTKDGNGNGAGQGDKLAGLGDGDGSGSGKDGKAGKNGKGGKSGTGDGEGDDPNGVVGAGKGGLQKVASLGSGNGGQQGGSSGGQGGQSGSQGGSQGGQQGGQQGGGQQGGQSGGGSQSGGASGGGGSPGSPSGGGGGGNPLQLVTALLRAILGL